MVEPDELGFETLSLGLAPSCQITSATLNANRLVILTGPATAACKAVYIVDIADGTVIGNVNP